MRRHEIVVAGLHAVAAAFVGGLVVLLWVSAAGLAPLFAGSFVPELFATVGRPVAIFFLVVASLDGLAALVLLTRPSRAARSTLIVVSLPLLAVFPIGTAIAGYTLWALLAQTGRHTDVVAPGPR